MKRTNSFPVKNLNKNVADFKSTRKQLTEILGLPEYVETDSFCTAGGEEDWWYYENSDGDFFVVVLRISYEHGSLLSTTNDAEKISKFISKIFSKLNVEVFDEPYVYIH